MGITAIQAAGVYAALCQALLGFSPLFVTFRSGKHEGCLVDDVLLVRDGVVVPFDICPFRFPDRSDVLPFEIVIVESFADGRKVETKIVESLDRKSTRL